MTNHEAIRLIRNLPTMCEFADAYGEPIDSDAYYEAVDMAIFALQEQPTHTNTPNALDCVERYVAIDTIKNMRKVCDMNDINESHKEGER